MFLINNSWNKGDNIYDQKSSILAITLEEFFDESDLYFAEDNKGVTIWNQNGGFHISQSMNGFKLDISKFRTLILILEIYFNLIIYVNIYLDSKKFSFFSHENKASIFFCGYVENVEEHLKSQWFDFITIYDEKFQKNHQNTFYKYLIHHDENQWYLTTAGDMNLTAIFLKQYPAFNLRKKIRKYALSLSLVDKIKIKKPFDITWRLVLNYKFH